MQTVLFALRNWAKERAKPANTENTEDFAKNIPLTKSEREANRRLHLFFLLVY